ncbi:hypothetical protein A2394_00515 [Candidatus Woesebacteria bacterium RIFOXYB1_FULL_42_36]|uniref:Uncharacterized protein n=2 Tax=Candidatus Woeseibacteriota TaxID=1752722 RepID=A0A837I9B1_9BACT|nr:MAG: hypothetical protein UW20_C0004G0047 [Candidatus Woesebacteria bacterium GW2011_GWB1_44_11]KKT54385.1 MAG: hypothetical protein UW47_C0006G0033 [Candidatus Woesebacteria bacterium GW2011_GWA1_44_23]OGM75854.1 MAG: hypothetical protein A2208_01765 [Candidatus Woesebacteria bacterium RIFOXYA1_FULL_43_16]OGM83354.1 MAG: hypothetical protein A2394_00515 [Candidatus Woesebacteria bacterium RIFOXYB1_FULL_42_36]OGM84530.1 MAG: hypothetical protein A2421_00865 [Candidatus Woesebacteria bacteriu
MVTVVNNPPSQGNEEAGSGNGMWGFLGVLLVILAVIALLIFGLPVLRNLLRNSGTPQVNIPSEIDVNVNQPNP